MALCARVRPDIDVVHRVLDSEHLDAPVPVWRLPPQRSHLGPGEPNIGPVTDTSP